MQNLSIYAFHQDFPNGYKAQLTYPIFAKIENKIFKPIERIKNKTYFVLFFELAGKYDLLIKSDDCIIEKRIIEVISSF